MEIQQLRCFVVSAEKGSFKDAAETLFLSRTAVSKSVGKLEDDLGYALFDRLRDGVRLTPAGQRFYQRAATLVGDYDELDREIRRECGSPSVSLCIPNSWTEPFLPGINAFRREHPDVRVDIVNAPDATCIQKAEAGEVDMVISHIPISGMLDQGKALVRSPLVVAMTKDNPLSAKQTLGPADIAEQYVVYYICGYETFFWVPEGVCKGASYDNDMLHIYARVERGECVFFTPDHTAARYMSNLAFVPFKGPFDTVTMFGFVSPRVEENPALREICLALRDALVIDGQ